MKQLIKSAILYVIEWKRAHGDVLPCATSFEVADRLKMKIKDVERLAKDIEGIQTVETNIYDCYYE